MIPTGGQDYFIGVVHAHALGIIWANLDVERSELEDDGRCLGRDKPRGRLRETTWTRQTKWRLCVTLDGIDIDEGHLVNG